MNSLETNRDLYWAVADLVNTQVEAFASEYAGDAHSPSTFTLPQSKIAAAL